ncbi:MAG: hypothetical protein ACFFC3_03320 [Candidatus Odinarchaeota archaeon]
MKDDSKKLLQLPIKVDPHDLVIIKNLKRCLSQGWIKGFDKFLYEYEKDLKKEGVYEDDRESREILYGDLYGVWYKVNEEGKVILIWYNIGLHNRLFSVLDKIPENLLELSYLKYLYLFCNENAIETMPTTLKNFAQRLDKSHEIFEIFIEPIGSIPNPLAPNRRNSYYIFQDVNVYEGRAYLRNEKKETGFELIIVRRDLIPEIYRQAHKFGFNKTDKYIVEYKYRTHEFLKNEIFKRFWNSD